jgi:MFS family permease
MFFTSRRFGALADRYGPRFFMGAGPLVGAAGLLLFQRVGAHVDFVTDVLPALLVFSVGLSMTVAPLTAAVLAGVDSSQAGIASGVNNAIARVAGLIGTAGVGAVVAASFASTLDRRLAHVPLGSAGKSAVEAAKRLPLGLPEAHGLPAAQARALRLAAEQASVHSFHLGLMIAAALLAGGGLIGALGIRNPRGRVRAEECPQGQFVGVGAEIPERARVGAQPA